MTGRRPARRRVLAGLASLALAATTAACGSDDGTATALTRAEIEERAQLDLPSSLDGFRATRTSSAEVHLTATVTDADATALADELDLAADQRVVTHSSPLWELNPLGPIRGGTSRAGEVDRRIEVVDDDGPRSTLRVILDGV